MRMSRLIVRLALIALAVLLLIFGEGNYSTAGVVALGVRKALTVGASPEEIYQVVALAASTIGLPNTVAVFTWADEVINK